MKLRLGLNEEKKKVPEVSEDQEGNLDAPNAPNPPKIPESSRKSWIVMPEPDAVEHRKLIEWSRITYFLNFSFHLFLFISMPKAYNSLRPILAFSILFGALVCWTGHRFKYSIRVTAGILSILHLAWIGFSAYAYPRLMFELTTPFPECNSLSQMCSRQLFDRAFSDKVLATIASSLIYLVMMVGEIARLKLITTMKFFNAEVRVPKSEVPLGQQVKEMEEKNRNAIVIVA